MSSFTQNATVVLVHGAWADGSCWQNVILPLRNNGLQVTCAPIPLTSLEEDIAALKRVLERTNGPSVLAGHAYGGAVIAGPNDDRVKSLVYIAALAPAEGETVAGVFYRAQPAPGGAEAPARRARVHLDAGRRLQPRSRSQGFTGPDNDSRSSAAPYSDEMHSRESSCAGVENETILVSTRGRGSHDCARHATIHGGADGRENSRSPCGSQSDVYGAGSRG